VLAGLEPEERSTLRHLLRKATGAAPAHTPEACAVVTGEDRKA
jgi:hypothetical protein